MLITKKIGRRKLEEFYTYITFNYTDKDPPINYLTEKVETYTIKNRYPYYEYSVHIDRRTAKVDYIFKYTDNDVFLFTP